MGDRPDLATGAHENCQILPKDQAIQPELIVADSIA
jgi:hypothetical protein